MILRFKLKTIETTFSSCPNFQIVKVSKCRCLAMNLPPNEVFSSRDGVELPENFPTLPLPSFPFGSHFRQLYMNLTIEKLEHLGFQTQ